LELDVLPVPVEDLEGRVAHDRSGGVGAAGTHKYEPVMGTAGAFVTGQVRLGTQDRRPRRVARYDVDQGVHELELAGGRHVDRLDGNRNVVLRKHSFSVLPTGLVDK